MAQTPDDFVDVYSKKTGRKHRVPAHFLTHPVLKKPWRKTPLQRAADGESTGAEPGSATPITDVVTAASGSPSSTPSTTDTPATGDEKE